MTPELSMRLTEEMKPYQAPQIVLEIELETQAGSPLSLPDLADDLAETP